MKKSLLRTLVCAGVSLVVLAATFLGTAVPATAVARHDGYSAADGDNLTKKYKGYLKALDKMFQRSAHNATKKKAAYLDYKAADKYDDGHSTLRRQLAAGWIDAGAKVTNISKDERKKVMAQLRQHPKPDPASVHAQGSSSSCQGRDDRDLYFSGVPTMATFLDAEIYFNSCHTEELVYQYNKLGTIMGMIGALLSLSGALIVPGIVAIVAGGAFMLTANEMQHWANESALHAVELVVRASMYSRVYPQYNE